jgi:hypothetical protein
LNGLVSGGKQPVSLRACLLQTVIGAWVVIPASVVLLLNVESLKKPHFDILLISG